MRFDFCGNSDCPEWVLSGVTLVNRMSTVKLRLILGQIVKKIQGLNFDQEKLQKLCKDQDLEPEDTRCLLAIIEFVLAQAAKHDIADAIFNKDLMQMGVAIENANGITKAYLDNQDQLVKAMRN